MFRGFHLLCETRCEIKCGLENRFHIIEEKSCKLTTELESWVHINQIFHMRNHDLPSQFAGWTVVKLIGELQREILLCEIRCELKVFSPQTWKKSILFSVEFTCYTNSDVKIEVHITCETHHEIQSSHRLSHCKIILCIGSGIIFHIAVHRSFHMGWTLKWNIIPHRSSLIMWNVMKSTVHRGFRMGCELWCEIIFHIAVHSWCEMWCEIHSSHRLSHGVWTPVKWDVKFRMECELWRHIGETKILTVRSKKNLFSKSTDFPTKTNAYH
jgi:hypothetical protein